MVLSVTSWIVHLLYFHEAQVQFICVNVQVGQKFELLNCDKHKSIAKKLKRDITLCRPDITHQVISIIIQILNVIASLKSRLTFQFMCLHLQLVHLNQLVLDFAM